MPGPTTGGELATALHRFGRERERLRTAVARALGIPAADLEALTLLRARGAVTQRELGDRLMLTSGAVTTLVDRLVRSGMAERHPNPDDRRSVLVRPTEGAAAAHPALADLDREIERAERALDPAARAEVVRLLDAVVAAAAAAVERIGPAGTRPGA